MIRKLVMPAALAAGVLLAGSSAEARDGCGPGFHRNFYGWCRPNAFYRPFVVVPGYRWRYGHPYAWHQRFGWNRGFRHAGWHGGWHRGWHGGHRGGWHHRW